VQDRTRAIGNRAITINPNVDRQTAIEDGVTCRPNDLFFLDELTVTGVEVPFSMEAEGVAAPATAG
jgi:hypothetical protein